MDNLKSLITEKDTWTSAKGRNDEIPFLLRFRPNLKGFILSQGFNTRFIIVSNYSSNSSSLLPDNDEMD